MLVLTSDIKYNLLSIYTTNFDEILWIFYNWLLTWDFFIDHVDISLHFLLFQNLQHPRKEPEILFLNVYLYLLF